MGAAAVKAACNWQNRPAPPGMAMTMLRSSPSNFCHSKRVAVCRWQNPLSKRSSSVFRCGGSSIVFLSVSTFQPRMVLKVVQQASPRDNFLVEMGSRRPWRESSASLGRNTRSLQCSKVRRKRLRRVHEPWASIISSSR